MPTQSARSVRPGPHVSPPLQPLASGRKNAQKSHVQAGTIPQQQRQGRRLLGRGPIKALVKNKTDPDCRCNAWTYLLCSDSPDIQVSFPPRRNYFMGGFERLRCRAIFVLEGYRRRRRSCCLVHRSRLPMAGTRPDPGMCSLLRSPDAVAQLAQTPLPPPCLPRRQPHRNPSRAVTRRLLFRDSPLIHNRSLSR